MKTPCSLLLIPCLFSAVLLPNLAAQTPAAQTPAAQAPAPQPKPPVRVRTKLDGFDLSPSAGKSPNQVGGASRDLGDPALFAPNLGKTYTTRPQFHWETADPGARVTFRLSSGDGQTVFETVTTAASLDYPSTAPALLPGSTYHWTIIPENDLLGGTPKPVGFVVVSGEERTAIANELQGAKDEAARAGVFVNHRVWYDAIQAYSDLLTRMPADKDARAARAQLYDQLPTTKNLADADWRMVY